MNEIYLLCFGSPWGCRPARAWVDPEYRTSKLF
jgi:hypothetical protein